MTETLGAPMANYGFDSTVYDNEDRLTAWSRVDDNKDQEWELSAAGDWESFTEEAVEVERTHNDVHELTAVGQTSLTYDAKGNLTKDGAQTYAKYIWDFDNRLQAVDTDDDDTSEVFYTYDALGRRITKSIVVLSGYGGSSASSGISRRSAGGRSITRRGASTTVTTTTVFVPDGQQEVAEYTYVSTVGTPNLTKKYVYAAYIDEPVLMLNVSGETETKYYYHQNSLYSIGALTDQSGTVVERYSYLAYGNITFHDADGSVADPQSSTVANPYLFTGRRFDEETGLQYSRARYYHFNLGRWISRDPIGYLAESVNLYEYVISCPLNWIDPNGTEVAGANHCYPLHLGGSNSQPLIQMTKEQHTAFHNYFRKNGFGYGEAGRKAWTKLSPHAQKMHILRACRAAGMSISHLNKYIGAIMKGATPGVKTIRSGCGKISKIALGTPAAVVLIVLTEASVCHAAEISYDWRESCPSGGKKAKCECKETLRTLTVPSWWAFLDHAEYGPTVRVGGWVDFGEMTGCECAQMEEGEFIVDQKSVLGFTIYNLSGATCRFNGYEGGDAFYKEDSYDQDATEQAKRTQEKKALQK